MIDQDDTDLFALLWPGGGGLLAIAGLIIWAFLQYTACQNEKECAARACPTAEHAEIVHGDCLCVRATP